MPNRALICLVLELLSAHILFSQRVYHLNVDNGLCTNSLTDLTFDHEGNLWIGSYGGLMKMSGTHIKCIDKVGPGPDAISGLEMHSVSEDQCGYIWIGTTAGLDKIDPVTFEVVHYPIRSPFEGSSSVGYLYAVFADRHDFIWLCTDEALFKFDIITGQYAVVPVKKDKSGIPHYSTSYNAFVEDENGIWMSTGAGIVYFEYKSQEYFHRYHNPEGKSIFNVTTATKDMQSDLRQDAKGKLWWVLENNALASYDIAADQVDTFHIHNPPGTWTCCHSIGIDPKDNIWIGSRHGGVQIFDQELKSFQLIRNEGVNRYIHSDYIYSIERGQDGQMFVATDNGLDVLDLYDQSLQEIKLSDNNDFLNLKFEAGDMSFDANEESVFIPFYKFGFFQYRLADGLITPFDFPDRNKKATPLIYHQDGKMYLASSGNLESIKIDEGQVSFSNDLLLPDSISNTHGEVIWCYQESPKSFYLKKSSGKIFYIHGDSIEVLKGYGFKPNISLSPDHQYLSYVTHDLNLVRRHLDSHQDDTIQLQVLLNKTNFSFSNPREIADDGESVWLTGQNGIVRMNYQRDTLMYYGADKGLSHSFTFSIVLDKKKNVWVGSLGGVDRYDAGSDRFVSVHRDNSNTYMDAFGSAICSKEGDLFFNFGNKLVRIRPDQKVPVQADLKGIVLNEVLVNGHHVDWHLPGSLNKLQYDQNRLTFIYDLLIFDNTDIVTFFYRLDGKEWIINGQRNEVNLDGISSGRHELEVRGSIGSLNNTTKAIIIPFRIRPPWWKAWWFFALIGLGIFSAMWIVFKGRIEKYKRELVIARQIAELESKALRAQMNPHFVFNSLNAIQECIVTGKIDEAYTYLSKFSRLLRIVLEQSDMTEVSLQAELEVLNLYVSLEKLRFKDEMQIDFKVNEELDAEEILIPPMLIQPHLENAIWHGLRDQSGEKILIVSIDEKTPGYLDVIVEDNGIGRVKADGLKKNRLGQQKHQSKGSKLSEDRLAILKTRFPQTAMKIEDLYDDHGIAKGTLVHLVIPTLEKKSMTPNTTT